MNTLCFSQILGNQFLIVVGTLKLEKPASIYSIYENKIIGSNKKEIPLAIKQGDTNVYFIDND